MNGTWEAGICTELEDMLSRRTEKMAVMCRAETMKDEGRDTIEGKWVVCMIHALSASITAESSRAPHSWETELF